MTVMNRNVFKMLLGAAVILSVAFIGMKRNAVRMPDKGMENTPDAGTELRVADYDSIPLRKRIGRMFVVGLDSSALKKDDPIIEKIQGYGVGGIILFGYNIPKPDADSSSMEKLRSLCAQLQSLSAHKLMIGIDQEGGKVMRLRAANGYREMPSHAYLGMLDNEDTTRYYAAITAGMLEEIGINTNFGPCVDVNVNPLCPVIGKVSRSFSSLPQTVGRHASFFIEEHRKHDVLTAVKHFPGHGSSIEDSHNGMTDISHTWIEDELVPYELLFRKGCCDIVMAGHIFNSRIDSLYPASLSRLAVDSLLRKSLKWNGTVISDDLGMKAISSNYSLEESLELCINAGVDMIMLIANGTPERIQNSIDIVEKAVTEGRIPESRINESYGRICGILSD